MRALENYQSDSDALKDWTIMIYLGGDNNLSEECIWAIKEMLRVGLTNSISVIAQFDTRVPGVPIRRYDIGRILGPIAAFDRSPENDRGTTGNNGGPRGFDTDGLLDRFGIAQEGERSASARQLKKFMIECAEAHPAKRYMLVLSGHGSGAVGDFLLKDDNPPDYLSIPRLRWAIKKANKALNKMEPGARINILGLDACAMSMAEVGYELRNEVDYMVGAEGFVKNTGWPYHRILETLNKNSAIETEVLANAIVERYNSYYSDYVSAGVSVDLAACDLSQHFKLREAVKYLSAALTNGLLSSPQNPGVTNAIILAHWRAQSYKFEEYVDLWDFCDLLERGCPDAFVGAACARVKNAITGRGSDPRENGGDKWPADNRRYVQTACFSGPSSQHSHGLSVYFPWVEDRLALNKYKNLSFPKDTAWGSFIEAYVKQTRRAPRQEEGRPMVASPRGLEGAEDVDRYITDVDRYITDVDRYITDVDRYITDVDRIIAADLFRFITDVDKGMLGLLARVKNPPTEFLRHSCNGEKEHSVEDLVQSRQAGKG